MKINNRTFNYPVLADWRDDYQNCAFDAACNFTQNENSLQLNFSLGNNCAAIQNLLDAGKAEYLVHFECPATIFRTAIKSAAPDFSCEINLSRVKGVLEIVAMIILKENIFDFYSGDWSADFAGLKFNLAAGNVLACKVLPSLKIPDDPNKFANPESIFTVCRIVGEESKFSVDFDGDKIKINLSAAEYDFFVSANENPALQPLVNSLIILPALVYILEELQTEGALELYESQDWFISLKNNCADFVDKLQEEDLLELAQELMTKPVTRAFESLKKFYDEDSE